MSPCYFTVNPSQEKPRIIKPFFDFRVKRYKHQTTSVISKKRAEISKKLDFANFGGWRPVTRLVNLSQLLLNINKEIIAFYLFRFGDLW